MPKFFRLCKFVFPLALIFFAVLLCFKNYTPNTYLIGWDSLNPEFNFKIAFERVFSGVWRQDQGVGAIAAHSHMADWPRIVFLWISSFILPLGFLRYFYIFLCLILGPLGIYFFLKYIFSREKDGLGALTGAFLGALYYLLNLATLQHFFVPFEMFTTQYAFMPWLFYFALRFLRENKKRNLVLFSIITLISSPQAYAATLWYAFFGGFGMFVSVYSLLTKNSKVIKKGILLGVVTILLNLYWILPNIYSIHNQSEVVVNSKINQLFSPEAYLQNFAYSDIKDTIIYKNFLFSWRIFDFDKGQFANLLQIWINHLNQPFVQTVLYSFPFLAFLGILTSIFKKDRVNLAFFGLLLYSLFFLVGSNYFSNLSIFREALRMPFTKFSITFLFGMTFFVGYFFSKVTKKAFASLFCILIVGSGLIYSMLPAFGGNLIYPSLRRDLPNEYKQAFDWFNNHDDGRVSLLPLNTLWGWNYRSWGYEGSDFLSFGIKSPLLDRDFDRWSPYNESFFAESAFALYANTNEDFENTLKKYQAKYLLLDGSTINPGGSDKLLYLENIEKLVSTSKHIKKVSSFGFLTTFETDFGNTDSFISAPDSYIKVNSDLTYSQTDPIYSKVGNYIQDQKGTNYPFVNLDPRGPVKIEIKDQNLELVNKITKSKVVLSTAKKISESFSEGRGFATGYNCDLEKLGTVNKEKRSDFVRYSANNGGVECDFYSYPEVSYSQAYIFRIKGKNIEGRSLKIYLQNWKTEKMDLEELLPAGEFDKYFVILPKKDLVSPKGNGGGYSLNLETRSFGAIASKNEVESIDFYPIDFDYLMTFKEATLRDDKPGIQNNLKIKDVQKYGTWGYKVDVEGDGLIQLGQGYESGWKAFPELKHVKINSWANGWIVPPTDLLNYSSIYLIYWPQFLEFGGIILGVIAVILTILTSIQRKLY